MTQLEIQQKIKEIADKIANEFKPEKVILFGSYAWGNPGLDSDVDLFIVKKTKDTRATARKIDRFIFPRSFPIDLLVYTPKQAAKRKKEGDFFLKDILEKGKVLYAG